MNNHLSNTQTVIPHLMRDLHRYLYRFLVKPGMTPFPSLRARRAWQSGFIKFTKRTLVLILIVSILLPSFILYSLFIIPKTASAAWADDNWGYRTSYSINNTGAADSNKKIKFDIDTATLITNGKLQSDCDDSRFTDQNGNLLDYFIDTNEADCNNASTDYYVTVPTINAGRTIIYHYYGNSSATRGRKDDFLPPANASTLGVGLKGYWKLDESSSTRYDYTHTNNLTDNATVTSNPGRASIGTAGQFTKTNSEYLSITDNTDLSMGSGVRFTVAGWVYLDTKPSSGAMVMVGKWNNSPNQEYTVIWDTLAVDRFRFYVSNTCANNTPVTANTFGSPSTGTWYFIVAWYDGTNINISVNNGAADSVAFSSDVGNCSAEFRIGSQAAGTHSWDGRIDGVGVWKKVLTAAERTALYNSGNGVDFDSVLTFSPASTTAASEEKSPGPVAYWKFDDGTGTTAQDSTQNNLDGTLSGASWQTEDLCISGKCLFFDGSNDRINLGNPSALSITGTTITVSAWIKTLSSGSSEQAIITRRTQGNGTQYTLRLLSTNYLCFDWDDSSSVYKSHCDTTTALSTNTWYFVAATYNGSQVVIYVNGKAVITFSETAALASKTNNNYIGFYDQTGNNSWFKGFIDEPKIYNYALTAAQVLANFNSRSNADSASASFSQTPNNNYKALNNGLVGYWKMDEASGNRSDSSGNANTLTDNATVTSNPGKFGNAGQFTSANSEYLSISDNSTLSSGSGVSFTVSAWVYLDSTSGNLIILSRDDGGANREWYLIVTNPAQGTRFRFVTIGSTNAVVDGDSLGAPTTGTWYFITAWHDSTTGKSYLQINNGGIDSAAGSDPSDTSAPFRIGAHGDNTNYFNGRIEEARVYKKVLTSTERTALYNFAPGPVGYWKMDENTGTTANDSSGNARTGTINGNPIWAPGKYGGGLKMDGTGDDIQISDF